MMGEIVVDSGIGEIAGQPVFIGGNTVFFNPTHADCVGQIDVDMPRFWKASVINPATPTATPALRYNRSDWRKGQRWMCSLTLYTNINTIRPPNSESCQGMNSDGREGTYTAGSRHQGGCHVLMTDGAVKFITESIDCGNQKAFITADGIPSPYGVWGALGTAGMKEDLAAKYFAEN